MKKRIVSIIMALSMCLSMLPPAAFAAVDTGLCTHHTEHTPECGYVEAEVGVDCTHSHDDTCGYAEAVVEVPCACVDTDETGALVHTEGCGYVAPVAGRDCAHAHDESCGYAPAVEAHPCHYECGVCAVQDLIDALPDEVIAENADMVAAHLDAIDMAKAELTADELALVDLTRYTAAAQALGALAAAEAVCTCETKCTADAINSDCTVCSAEGADLTACTGQEAPVCTCGTDDPDIHSTNCPAYVAPENPACSCAEKCDEDAPNLWCDVCGVQGAAACMVEGETATYEGTSVTIDAASLTSGDGDSWSFDGSTLTLKSGYEFTISGECNVTVVNNGTIVGGTFNKMVINNGTISGGTFTANVNNNAEGVITGGDMLYTVSNRGTIEGGTFSQANNTGTITGGTFSVLQNISGEIRITNGSAVVEVCIYDGGTITVNGTGHTHSSSPTTVYKASENEGNHLKYSNACEGCPVNYATNFTEEKHTPGDAGACCVCKLSYGSTADHTWNTEGVCSDCGEPAVAQLTAASFDSDDIVSYYTDLQAALNAGAALTDRYGNIKLLDDVTGNFTADGPIGTIDLNGKTITAGSANTPALKITDKYDAMYPCVFGGTIQSSVGTALEITGETSDSYNPKFFFGIEDNGLILNGKTAIKASSIALELESGSISATAVVLSDGATVDFSVATSVDLNGGEADFAIEGDYTDAPLSFDTINMPGTVYTITMENPGVFAKPGTFASLYEFQLETSMFTSAMEGYVVAKNGDNLKLAKGITEGMVRNTPSDEYNGSAHTVAASQFTVVWRDTSGNETTLTPDTDYEIQLPAEKMVNAGDYTITIVGKGDYAGEVEATYTIVDKLAPTGTIAISTNNWTSFLNTITFGLFFKDTVDVTVTADGTGSDVATVEYQLLSTAPSTENDVPNINWTGVAASNGAYKFSIIAQQKGAVYVRITDEGGNTAVINSDGIVVYSDSAAGTSEVSYSYKQNEDQTVSVTLNGNTVKSVACGGTELTANTDYTVADGTITLKAAYLNTLGVGTHTFTVSYNPMGMDTSAVTLATTTFTVKVATATITGATVTVDSTGLTYDGTAKEPTDLTVTLDGNPLTTDDFEITGYSNNTNAGTATVTIQGKGNYTGEKASNFTIGQAAAQSLTGEIAVTNGHAYEYTFDLSGYKPTGTNVSWGDSVTYTLGTVSITESGYYTDGAKIEGNTLPCLSMR